MRIILKVLKSLSFDIASDDVIKELQDELHTIKVKYQKNVSKGNGLHLHTQVQPTSSFERVSQNKLLSGQPHIFWLVQIRQIQPPPQPCNHQLKVCSMYTCIVGHYLYKIITFITEKQKHLHGRCGEW